VPSATLVTSRTIALEIFESEEFARDARLPAERPSLRALEDSA
jgi:hypothetical protein